MTPPTFNLTEALRTGRAVTRDGREVTNITINHSIGSENMLSGSIGNNSYWVKSTGIFSDDPKVDHPLDLFNTPEQNQEPEMYVNVHKTVYKDQLETRGLSSDKNYMINLGNSHAGDMHSYVGTYKLTKVK